MVHRQKKRLFTSDRPSISQRDKKKRFLLPRLLGGKRRGFGMVSTFIKLRLFNRYVGNNRASPCPVLVSRSKGGKHGRKESFRF